jgi:hypothetical protein
VACILKEPRFEEPNKRPVYAEVALEMEPRISARPKHSGPKIASHGLAFRLWLSFDQCGK